MENRTNSAVIEISDTSVKFAVGYCINKKPVIVYTKSERLPEGAVVNGRIQNAAVVKEVVSRFLNIEDESVRRKVNDIVSVVIPPNGFKNLIANKSTFTSNADGMITPQDVSNIVNQTLKMSVLEGSAVVDYVPTKFAVDGKQVKLEALYGTVGKELMARVELHTVNTATLNEQKISIQQSGFRTDRSAVAPYCSAMLISNDKTALKNYFYADFGARLTTITLIADRSSPFVSHSFPGKGGDDLTLYIANHLLIDAREAEKLKVKFGYNERDHIYDMPIWEGINLRGEQVKIMQSDLNAVLKGFFGELNEYLSNALRTICQTSDKINPSDFELICGGGATKLRGFDKLIEPLNNIVKETILYVPKVPGARDPGLINLLGLITINGENKEHTDGSFRGMSTLVRQ